MSNFAIVVDHVSKRYGTQVALDDLSLQVSPGQWVALLGPNGAGKSTLFQLLTGLFVADQGEVLVGGHAFSRAASRALSTLGVVFQSMSLDLDLSVQRNLRFHADLHGLARSEADARAQALGAMIGLPGDLSRPVRALSGGQRRKVELVRALLHRPRVLLMDEPTVGLDMQSRRDLMRAVQQDVKDRGTAVLWATHLVDEALAADRVVVLHQGKLLAQGTPADVTSALGEESLEQGFLRATGKAKPAVERAPEAVA